MEYSTSARKGYSKMKSQFMLIYNLLIFIYNILNSILYLLELNNISPTFLQNNIIILVILFLPPIILFIHLINTIYFFYKRKTNNYKTGLLFLTLINLVFLIFFTIGTFETIDYLKGG